MQKYCQKWTLVKFLEPVNEGFEFFWKDWPLHITLADTFAVNWKKDELSSKLNALLANQNPIVSKAKNYEYFGDADNQHKVLVIEKTNELKSIHKDIVDLLKNSGAVFNEPQFVGRGFVPHINVEGNQNFLNTDAITIDEVTIIDMFPGADGERRKALSTIFFAG